MGKKDDKSHSLEHAELVSIRDSEVAIVAEKGKQHRQNLHVRIRSILAIIIIGTIIYSFFSEKLSMPDYFIGFAQAILAYYFLTKSDDNRFEN